MQRLEDGKGLQGGVTEGVRRMRAGATLALAGPGGELASSMDMGMSVAGMTMAGGMDGNLNIKLED